MSKRTLRILALVVVGVVGIGVIAWRQAHRDRGQAIADRLRAAGYKEDDAGRFVFKNPMGTGLSLAYDPNLRDPTVGFGSAIARINSCLEKKGSRQDACIQGAPRCVSLTPWKSDPAGEGCFPESCFQEHSELRKTQSESGAYLHMVRGTCYPGMKALLRGEKP